MSLHNDITKYIHEFEYKEHEIKIVERKFKYESPFLFLYIQKNSNETYIGQHITQDELKNLQTLIPKIKNLIDEDILTHEKWIKEKKLKKLQINWTGQKFKRGDYVHFKGNDKYKPCDTYVWTHFGHETLEFYLIQHIDGLDRSNWMAKPPFENMDGFECVHSSQLKEGLKYIQINCHEEFQGETDQLILIERGQKIK